ncbi:histidine-rich glycoprotein [Anastrepha obliqua]|uniref:histidine-rich glycoprotein n=1 Tax=Anastrepha obliqua TaxID=95512 RepID=UPI00240A362E|nr:histidine-rich glycoprotein [Anastrepha obliqua]
MTALKVLVIFSALFALAYSAPHPGFFGGKHEHHTIHVPYHVHTIHHHHIKKVHVPVVKEVEVIKHVPIYKEVHVPVIKEVHVPVHVHHEEEHHHIEEGHKGGWY